MRRFIVALAGAALASNVLASTAETRSQVVDNDDGFGSGGRQHISVGGRNDRRGSGLRYRPTHYFGTSGPGYGVYDRYNPHCRFPQEWPKKPPWPPFCN
jgi:hypothetical protein